MFLTFLLSYSLTFHSEPANPLTFSPSHFLFFEMTDFNHPNFKLQYPDSWEIDTSGAWGAEVMLFAPLENEEDNFRENVNVLIQDLTGQNVNLELFKEITESQINTLATEGHIIDSSIKGDEYRITYTMTQGMFKLKITTMCVIQNEKAYVITFTSELDKYDQYKMTGTDILASFTLIK